MRLSVRVYCTIAVLTIVIIVAMVIGCSKSVVIDMPPTKSLNDTTWYATSEKADTTEKDDTVRYPISFDVTVEDWEDVN